MRFRLVPLLFLLFLWEHKKSHKEPSIIATYRRILAQPVKRRCLTDKLCNAWQLKRSFITPRKDHARPEVSMKWDTKRVFLGFGLRPICLFSVEKKHLIESLSPLILVRVLVFLSIIFDSGSSSFLISKKRKKSGL